MCLLQDKEELESKVADTSADLTEASAANQQLQDQLATALQVSLSSSSMCLHCQQAILMPSSLQLLPVQKPSLLAPAGRNGFSSAVG